MNPLTNVRNVTKLSDRELTHGDGKTSWHDEYKDSAWIFIGGLPFDLSEGDIIAVFSQYGEIVNINLIRDKASGKSRGFGFLCYENQRSTVLVVDNFNGIKILGRTIRVDHVKEYKVPKDNEKVDDFTRQLWKEGCAPDTEFGGGPNPHQQDKEYEVEFLLPPPPTQLAIASSSTTDKDSSRKRKHSKSKKKRSTKTKKSEQTKKKYKKRSRRNSTSSSSSSDAS